MNSSCLDWGETHHSGLSTVSKGYCVTAKSKLEKQILINHILFNDSWFCLDCLKTTPRHFSGDGSLQSLPPQNQDGWGDISSLLPYAVPQNISKPGAPRHSQGPSCYIHIPFAAVSTPLGGGGAVTHTISDYLTWSSNTCTHRMVSMSQGQTLTLEMAQSPLSIFQDFMVILLCRSSMHSWNLFSLRLKIATKQKTPAFWSFHQSVNASPGVICVTCCFRAWGSIGSSQGAASHQPAALSRDGRHQLGFPRTIFCDGPFYRKFLF